MSQIQDEIKAIIESIPFAPYKISSSENQHDGITEDIYWDGSRLFRAADPPKSYCVGAVLEVFMKLLAKHKTPEDVSTATLKELKKWVFVFEGPEDDPRKYSDGVAGGLVHFGFADWVDDPLKAEYGDFAQIQGVQFNGAYDDGHSVICTGVGQYKNNPVMYDWSSNNIGERPGHMHDWHYIKHEKNGIARVWKIARIKESWLLG